MKDFFISYNKADRDWAVWIAQRLEDAGYSTVIQAEDMPPGSNFVLEMHKAAIEAERTIAVLSPDFLRSQFTQPEWAAAFAKDPTSANRTLLPVRVRECQPNGLLAQIVYIDLVGKEGEEARKALLDGLDRERERLSLPVPFPVDELIERYCRQLTEKVSRVRIFSDDQSHELDQVFVELSINEEYERRPNQAEFLGLMDAELRRMRSVFGDADQYRDREGADDPYHRHFAKTKRTVKPDELLRRHTHAVVTGAPGCGKTTLLRYLAWQTLKQWRTSEPAFGVPPSGGKSHDQALPPKGGTPNAQARFPVFLEFKKLDEHACQSARNKRGQLDFARLVFDQAVAELIVGAEEHEYEALFPRFRSWLTAGKVAIFLDGLDEVNGRPFFTALRESVNTFLTAYGANTVIISTRPFALPKFSSTKEMEILPLNPRQIEQFITHYYHDMPERQQFQRELQRRRELRELARVPALLGFILQLWRKRGSVTDDKLELYAQITLELAQQLDTEKEGVPPDRKWLVEDKDGSLKLDLLRQLAFNQLFKGLIHPPYEIGGGANDVDRLVFTSEQLRAEAAEFARTLKDREGLTIHPRNLAEDVKATALLRQVGADHYAFAHLTLQEYLAAWQLANRHDAATCERIFCRAYFNPTLAEMEVLPMTLGSVDEPDKLYEALDKLPDSLDYTNLRLRARGLANGVKVGQSDLDRLVRQLIRFIPDSTSPKSPYADIIFRSFSGLSGYSSEYVVDKIAPLLNQRGRLNSGVAAEILGHVGGEKAFNILRETLKDGPIGIRSYAAEALGEIGDERAVDDLLDSLNTNKGGMWKEAIALKSIGGERALQGLLEALESNDQWTRFNATWGLAGFDSEQAISSLCKALNDEDKLVRWWAANALGEIGGQRAVECLIKALESGDRQSRWNAAQALKQFDKERIEQAFHIYLKSADYNERVEAALVLGELGNEEAADVLFGVFEKDAENRWNASSALASIGSEHVVRWLLGALNDNDPSISRPVASALAKIDSTEAKEGLYQALKSDDKYLPLRAALELAEIGDKQATEVLVKALDWETDGSGRREIANALGKLGNARAVPGLLRELWSRSTFESARAARLLNQIPKEALAEGLLEALSDEYSPVRKRAAEVIGYYVS